MNDSTKAKLADLKAKALALLSKPTTYKIVAIALVVGLLIGAILL